MPLIQIIPYVADQFDPGSYVFDGGTFDSDNVLEGVAHAAYDVRDAVFNSNEILASGISGLGVFVPNEGLQFDPRQVVESKVLIFLEGVNWDATQTPVSEAQTFTMFTGVNWDATQTPIDTDDTLFTRLITGTVQNSIDQPSTRPYILSTNSSVTRETIESFEIDTTSVPATSSISEMTGTSIEIDTFDKPQFSSVAEVSSTFELRPDEETMIIETPGVSSLEPRPLDTIVSLITASIEQGEVHSPQFTM